MLINVLTWHFKTSYHVKKRNMLQLLAQAKKHILG